MDTDLDGPTGMCWAAEGEDTRSVSSSAGGAARVGLVGECPSGPHTRLPSLQAIVEFLGDP